MVSSITFGALALLYASSETRLYRETKSKYRLTSAVIACALAATCVVQYISDKL